MLLNKQIALDFIMMLDTFLENNQVILEKTNETKTYTNILAMFEQVAEEKGLIEITFKSN